MHIDRSRRSSPRRTPMKKRIIAAALTLALSASAAACSTERTRETDADTVDTVTLAMGGATSYVQNFNPFSPAANKSPLMNLVYEPLVRVNRADAMKEIGRASCRERG